MTVPQDNNKITNNQSFNNPECPCVYSWTERQQRPPLLCPLGSAMSSVKAVGNSIGLALTAVMEVVVIIERGGRAGTRHCVGRERERQDKDKDKRQGIRKRGFLTVDSEEHLNRHNVELGFIPSGATAASARSTAPPCGRRPVPFARNLTFGSIAKFRSPGTAGK